MSYQTEAGYDPINHRDEFEVTLACSIGKHNLCSGEGDRRDIPSDGDATPFQCWCPCHSKGYLR